jgi:hypothetical protein
MDRFPPMVTARTMLDDRFADLRQQVMHIWRSAKEAKDGSLCLPQEYLISTIHL